jgi:hypothetical protein
VDTQDFSELIALKAFDCLEATDELELELALKEFPQLQAELDNDRAIVASLAYSEPPVPMAEDLLERLFDRIDRETALHSSKLYRWFDSPLDALKQQTQGLTWQAVPGCEMLSEMAILEVDESSRLMAFFVRVASPGKFVRHRHALGEELLLLEGDFTVDRETYLPGDRLFSPGNSEHAPITQGCLLFGVSSLDDELLLEQPTNNDA